MHRVFVYASLKTNEMNSFHMADESHGKAVFIGKGRTSKKWPVIFVDYEEYTHFPAMIYQEGIGHQVEGEIWEVDDKFLKWLDEFEGHPYPVCRKTIQITHEDNSKEETCYIYFLMNFKGNVSESSTFIRSYNSAECGRPYKVT
ncbi:Gamma-glutamylaminecyclotransferase [Holothuria leucospilota]|uniref:Gamma-glutamylcyclotransferase family protein n=1 Tax=Holothuria leucospilota TaxID=206669 RepID=A0A9Q1HH80_HOLLE|nr:Gamma-glutamylaminecyclotransferase [Holothuria leucospilota]